MKTAPWLLAAILATAPSSELLGEQPTAEELLTGYQKSVERLTRARIECVEKHPERQVGENASFAETRERTIVRDGSRWKITDAVRTIRTTNGAKTEGGLRHEMIVGAQLLEVGQTCDGRVLVSAWLDPTKVHQTRVGTYLVSRDPARFHWKMLGGAELLFGRFSADADQPLWDVMRETPTLMLSPGTEEIDGVQTYVLKSRGKFGEHTLWIDSACGSLPRRIEIRKQLGNLYDDNQLGQGIGVAREPQPKPGQGPPSMQPPDIRAFSARIDHIQIENKDGVFVMTAWNAEEKITLGDGKPGERRSEHSVGAVDFKPDTWPKDVFAPAIEIPDKTRVRVHDGLDRTDYEWVGGEIRVRPSN